MWDVYTIRCLEKGLRCNTMPQHALNLRLASHHLSSRSILWPLGGRAAPQREREFFIDNLLVRVHRCFWCTGLVPWEWLLTCMREVPLCSLLWA